VNLEWVLPCSVCIYALDKFIVMVMMDDVTEPWNWRWPFASLVLRNSTIRDNGHGVVTRHYNQPTNEWLDIFQRFRWETIRMFGLTLVDNHYEAIHALSITRYHALYVPTFEELQRALRIAEISSVSSLTYIHTYVCMYVRLGAPIDVYDFRVKIHRIEGWVCVMLMAVEK